MPSIQKWPFNWMMKPKTQKKDPRRPQNTAAHHLWDSGGFTGGQNQHGVCEWCAHTPSSVPLRHRPSRGSYGHHTQHTCIVCDHADVGDPGHWRWPPRGGPCSKGRCPAWQRRGRGWWRRPPLRWPAWPGEAACPDEPDTSILRPMATAAGYRSRIKKSEGLNKQR